MDSVTEMGGASGQPGEAAGSVRLPVRVSARPWAMASDAGREEAVELFDRAVMHAVFDALTAASPGGGAAQLAMPVFRGIRPVMHQRLARALARVERDWKLRLLAAEQDRGLWEAQARTAARQLGEAQAGIDLLQDQVLELEVAIGHPEHAVRSVSTAIVLGQRDAAEVAQLAREGVRRLAERVTPGMLGLPIPSQVRIILEDLVTLAEGPGLVTVEGEAAV